MSEKPAKNENLSPKAQGFEAGLRIALCFALAFYWLGESAVLSIFLAAIAGLCGGCIIAWWHMTDEPEHQPPEVKKKTLSSQTKISNNRRRKIGLKSPKK